MSSSTPSSKTAPPPTASRATKAKLSKMAVLKLPSRLLSPFPHEQPARKPSQPKPTQSKPTLPKSSTSSTSTISTPIPLKESASPTDVKSETKTTPTPGAPEKPTMPADDSKRKGPGGAKAGVKRPLGAVSDGLSRPRAKPGPKRRKLDNGTNDNGESINRPWTTPAPLTGHKLGPKANQGAINAGLRALDRTGKPCRKWEKKVFRLKSFTGVTWEIPSWHAPKKSVVDIKSDSGQNGTPTSNSENQINNSSSNVGSDNSQIGNADIKPAPSSPALGVTVAA